MAAVKKAPRLPHVVSPPPHADSERLARAIGQCLPLVQTVNDEFIRVTGYEYTTQYDLMMPTDAVG